MADQDEGLKARLLAAGALEEADVEIAGVGTIRVRALTRAQAFHIQQVDGQMEKDALTLHHGLVDPVLSMEEIKGLQRRTPAGLLEPITDKIAELSKVSKPAAKAVYKNFEDNPEEEFRDVPGAKTEHDALANEAATS